MARSIRRWAKRITARNAPHLEADWPARVERGLLAGAIGAGSMTVVRAMARRAGWIDETVPEVMVEWLRGVTPLRDPSGGTFERAFLEAIHVLYGATWGAAAFQALTRSDRVVGPGAAFGALTWVASLVPTHGFGIFRPPWRARASENAVNVLAHVVYGLVTVLLAQEMTRQPLHGATGWGHRAGVRVG